MSSETPMPTDTGAASAKELVAAALKGVFEDGLAAVHVSSGAEGMAGMRAYAQRFGDAAALVNLRSPYATGDRGRDMGFRSVTPADLPEGYTCDCPSIPTPWAFGENRDSLDPAKHPHTVVRKVG